MSSTYTKAGEGEPFRSPDELFPHPALLHFLLESGQEGLDALPELSEQTRELVEQLIQAGLLQRDGDGRLRPTQKLVHALEHQALLEIFKDLKGGMREGHESRASGRTGERAEGTRPYSFGDPLSEVDVHQTLRNALSRSVRAQPASAGRRSVPLHLSEDDVVLHEAESSSDSALCVLIDLSGSMMRYGRHIAAKRVAMGLASLLRRRFPLDTLDFIGFSSVAEPIREQDLALVMPKPITTRDWQVRVRVPLDQASLTHPHFTNLHHGLRLARSTLRRRGAANKQLMIITDGEPTAHLTGGAAPGAEILNLVYPPSEASREATLAEALACAREGIRIASFALIEEYHTLDWIGFIERLTRLTRGVAYYCTAGDLEGAIMESYLSGRRRRVSMGPGALLG